MRLISKMAMIRWHYFDYELIDFSGKSTIITGDNGTGKSTIIDALQVILIANLKNIKFNSSAHEHKTERNLVTYLRGKIGSSQTQDENEGEFLRNEDFTSYLALEVEIINPKTKKSQYFILGVVFEYLHKYKDESHEFFRIDKHKLDDSLFFFESDLPRTKDQFFNNLKREGLSYEKYQTIEKYNNDVRHLLGGVKETFFSLLQKGISFSPITNLRKFIYDYILDSHEIDVSMMQDYVEQTNELLESIKTAEQQIEMLKEIRALYDEVERVNRNIIIGNFMEKRADYECLLYEHENLLGQLKEENHKLNENTTHRDSITTEKINLNEQIIELTELLTSHDIKVKQTLLSEKIEKIKVEIENISIKNRNIINKLKTDIYEREELIKTLNKLNPENELVQSLIQQNNLLTEVITNDDFISLPNQLVDFNTDWKNGFNIIQQQQYEWTKSKNKLIELEKELIESIKQLEKNQILSSKSPQMILKNLLNEEFIAKGENVSVDLLCEVIDIKNPKWRNAIEGYLHTQKFNILVPPGYFDLALNIYEENKYKYNIENVGLVDIEKVLKESKKPLLNSLAEEISIENGKEHVEPYINYLLGGVIKCSKVSDLRKYQRAITDTCMLYQSYTARQIPKYRYEQPYIGKNAIQVQLSLKKRDLNLVKGQISDILTNIDFVRKVLDFTPSKEDRYKSWEEEWKDSDEINELENIQSKLVQELFSLDTTEIDELEKQIQSKRNRVFNIDQELPSLSETIGENRRNITQIKESIEKNKEITFEKKELFESFSNGLPQVMLNVVLAKWDNEKKEPAEILKNYQQSNKGLETQRMNAFTPLVEARVNYNNKFLSSFNAQGDNNEEYDKILERLEESEIVKYKVKAEEAKEKAQQSFREDFIARLKDQIEKARSDFKEMNSILRELKFGTDSYHFKVFPNEAYRDYYDMLNDPNLERGYSIFSDSFDEEHGYIVKELFEKISGENSEKNEDLLDYRTYLDFELEVTDESGKTTRYSKVALEKSGGETQVPFYVSILASFYHAYHMGRKEDTFRLVIFDEAFNRMDANRVEEAIKFIQSCGFQTLIVAPTGKVALLAPHFENSLIVMKENYHSFVVPIAIRELLDFDVEEDVYEIDQESTTTP